MLDQIGKAEDKFSFDEAHMTSSVQEGMCCSAVGNIGVNLYYGIMIVWINLNVLVRGITNCKMTILRY